ncbi:hypothetical protein [Shewanella algae]|uniref:hypothetical protein n=1 Tax=Shewanella algae TaxID=38313 RepID=UPI0031F4ABD9
MKLEQQLIINGESKPLTSIKAVLSQGTAGRAIITLASPVPVGTLVSIALGYDKPRTWFTGYVDAVETLTAQHHRVILREPAAILAGALPLSLTHPTLKQVLDNIAAQTGLVLYCTEPAAVTQIANLTHQGTGYSLLAQLGVMFGLEDYTWYSQPDGSIWLGSWPDCHWASRPISVTPKLYCGEKAATGVQIPMLPAIRPESQVNGKRISQLMFDGEQLTLQWKQPESQTQREMKQQFPELGTQTHLAQLGRVVAICEPVKAGHQQNSYRPALGVDVQLLNPDGSDNKRVPVFQNVPLPGSLHHGQGQFAFAQPGSIVELGFAFGHSHRPFVRTILGLDWSMPGVSNGDYLCQFNEGLHRIDSGGSQQLHTEQQMTLSSQAMTISSDNQSQRLGAHQRLTEGDDIEQALGQRHIAANWLTLLGLSGTGIATEQNHEVIAGENLLETIGKLRKSIAARHWAGSEETNIYQLLLQLMNVVEAIAKTAAAHTHPTGKEGTPTGKPQQAGDFNGQSGQAKTLQDTLTPLI